MGQFSVDLTRIINKAKGRVDEVVAKATHEIFSSIVLKSPVDTGRFRANWIASVGSYGSATSTAIDPSGSGAINKMGGLVLKTKSGGIVYMVNSLPYARRLEFGYSNQAPAGMVRLTIGEFQRFVDKATK